MEALRILVVDDEPGMRLGVSRALRNFRFPLPELDAEVGFEVDIAEDAETGEEKIRAQAPDVLLLDYKLPGMSGLDLLERLGEQTEKILTIMITAYASLDTAVTAIKRGAYDFLAKPFTPAELKSTVRKAAESVIHARKARELAEERRRVRFEFIRVLAHELKAPLSAIQGYLQIIQDGTVADDPAAQGHMVDRSLVRLDQMRKLITDLLDLTRIESGQKKRLVEPVDLTDVAQSAIETMVPAAGERDITLELHAPSETPFRADRGEMEIILNNLVSNAVKYNRDGGRVDVTVEPTDSGVMLRVADTGIGMAPEESERLFEDFVRIKNARTKNILGSGLGLSIVKKLALLYEGDVRVQSQPDEGSTFTVQLKEPPAETPEEDDEAQRDTPVAAGG